MCFVTGCNIATPGGARAVDDIKPGDLLLTADGLVEPALWVGRSRASWAEQMANQRKRPIRVGRNALGPGVPERAVMISPQLRVLVRSPYVRRLAGVAEALVPSLALTGLPGVRMMPSLPKLDYTHIACAHHVLLVADGIALESALPGPLSLQSMSEHERNDLSEALKLSEGGRVRGDRARAIMSMRRAEKLVERSIRSKMPLVVPAQDDGLSEQRASG